MRRRVAARAAPDMPRFKIEVSMTIIIAPSVGGFGQAGRRGVRCRARRRLIHVDVMDARSRPNITWARRAGAIRRATALLLNVHLMIVEPERYLEDFKAGADHLLVQADPARLSHLHRAEPDSRAGQEGGGGADPRSPPDLTEYVLHPATSSW
jgi:ribulose-phosphate 3-epimerase